MLGHVLVYGRVHGGVCRHVHVYVCQHIWTHQRFTRKVDGTLLVCIHTLAHSLTHLPRNPHTRLQACRLSCLHTSNRNRPIREAAILRYNASLRRNPSRYCCSILIDTKSPTTVPTGSDTHCYTVVIPL